MVIWGLPLLWLKNVKKFAGAVMYVLAQVFDPREDMKMVGEPNEKEGKFLLNEIMQAGNFGKYGKHSITSEVNR